jgi:hypothetical protein
VPFRLSLDVKKLAERVKDDTAAQRRRMRTFQMSRLYEGFQAYEKKNHHLPPPAIYSKDGRPLLSWRVALLPYLGEEELYGKFKLDEPWDSPRNKKLSEKVLLPFDLPDSHGATHFQVFAGPGTMFDGKDGIAWNDVPDGREKTILLIEAAESVPWTKPADLTYAADKPLPKLGAFTKGGYYALFADGNVRFLPDETDPALLRKLITRSGGEAVDLNQLPPPAGK